MKKVFAVLAAASMFAFVACGGGETPATEGTDSTQVATEVPAEAPVEAAPAPADSAAAPAATDSAAAPAAAPAK